MNNPNELKFPDGFLWGAATASYQIEGGIENNWSVWERSEKRLAQLSMEGKDSAIYTCGKACDSFHRYTDDIQLLEKIGCNAYRFSFDWARLEPEMGKFNPEAIAYYHTLIDNLKAKNITPFATLWHWSNPVWTLEYDSWEGKRIVDDFVRYTEFIAKEFGSKIKYWVTLNEPMMIIAHGYLDGKFPPNRKMSLWRGLKVFYNLIDAHKSAYSILHKQNPDAQVGIAMTTGFFEPAHRTNPIENLIASLGNYFRNHWYLRTIKDYYDYIGVNYYHHDRMVWYPPFKKNLNKEVNDFGWEIYPEGIYQVVIEYVPYDKPIYILENGTSDVDDDHRWRFIADHLSWLHKAIEAGADVRGYFYWSLLDNFEWADGYTQHFGLAEVDRNTFDRKLRPSATYYAQTCKSNKLSLENTEK